jgi:diguanylate cyclase (GGDEF)-like protein
VKLHEELVRSAAGSQALNRQLATANNRLERMSIVDELTGVYNRRHAMARLSDLWAMAQDHGTLLSVAAIDIDHFKQVNDTWGHDAGDEVLKQFSNVLRGQTRGSDAVCRIGGEEFLIIFPSQSVQEAGVCAERCRMAVANHAFVVRDTRVQLTASIGVAARTREMFEPPELLRAADQALYAAKRAGRHAVRVADAPEPVAASVVAPELERPASDPAMRPPIAGEPADPAPAPVDMRAVLKRCAGDPRFAAGLCARFEAQGAGQIAVVEQAFAAGDAAALRIAAHNLKSNAAYLSADAASEIAGKIEELAQANRLAEVPALLPRLRAEVEGVIAWLAEHPAAALKCA